MSEMCNTLHHVLHTQHRHHFPFDSELIPKNGIYILFENGEKGHGADRIVHAGAHTGND
jgi:hypothetical protein